MAPPFPAAVPDVPVDDVAAAMAYYEQCLGFRRDWIADDGGIG